MRAVRARDVAGQTRPAIRYCQQELSPLGKDYTLSRLTQAMPKMHTRKLVRLPQGTVWTGHRCLPQRLLVLTERFTNRMRFKKNGPA